MYYYTEEILKQLAGKALGLYQNAGSYEELRSQINTEMADKILYAGQNLLEPYHADYISEIDDNTFPIRKLYKRRSSKMKHITACFYQEERLMFSLTYGGNGEITQETVYQYQDNCKIGLTFLTSEKILCSLTAETFDAQGKPCEFMHLQERQSTIYEASALFFTHRLYRYTDGCITEAEALDTYTVTKPVRLYDDEAYRSIGNVLTPDMPQMNPLNVYHYEFLYPEKGFPEAFVRNWFSYGKTGNPQFKIKNSLMKLYAEYGIQLFTKI